MKKTQTKTNKRGKAVGAVVLGALMLAGGCAVGYGAGTHWTYKRGEIQAEQPELNDIVAVSSDGEAMREGATYEMPEGITFFSLERASEDNAEFVEGTKLILTPTLSNEYIKGEFDWSVEYEYQKNGDSLPPDISVGGSADKFITVTATDEGRQAEVNYTGKFNMPIVLSVKLRGTDSEATCVITCMKSVCVERCALGLDNMGEDLDFEVCFEISKNGIFYGDVEMTDFTVSFTDEFRTEIQKYLKFPLTFTYKCYDLSDTPLPVPEGDIDNFKRGTSVDFYLDFKMQYSDFIEGFDSYDQAHKDAIYFAWHYVSSNNLARSISYELNFNHLYLGHKINDIYFEKEVGENIDIDWRTADKVTPNVTLNGNYVFN